MKYLKKIQTSGHSYGHIAMYNGTQWVSDFKQNSFWVANQYSVEKNMQSIDGNNYLNKLNR